MKLRVELTMTDATYDELQALLQAIRDCEMARFPQKVLGLQVETVPLLSNPAATALLRGFKPPLAEVVVVERME